MKEVTQELSESNQRVGLIGLGLMGRGMGLSLLRAGYPLGIVANRRRGVAEELVAAGAIEYDSPAALASEVDVVVTCLPSVDAVRQVLLGQDGIAPSAKHGALMIECSTLPPLVARELHEQLRKRSIGFVDCPLTRGPKEAMSGQLNGLMGGEDQAYRERAVSVVSAFCERVFQFGGLGKGYAAKLINNFLSFSTLTAVAEAMVTARKSALDIQTLIAAVSVSGGQSKSLSGYGPWLIRGDAPASILTVATAFKDVSYYCEHADVVSSLGQVAERTREIWSEAMAAGVGDEHTTEYLRLVAERFECDLQNDMTADRRV